MSRLREVAKFACGAVAFHALVHTYLLLSNTNLTVFGVTQTATWNGVAAAASLALSVGLGTYAWGRHGRVW